MIHDNNLSCKPDAPHSFDLFPRYCSASAYASPEFKAAYDLDVALVSAEHNNRLPKIIHHYSDAFRSGVADAGANLLRILILAQINYNAAHRGEYPLQDKIAYYIGRLNSLGHPSGTYYEALALLFGAIDTGHTFDANIADGLSMMYAAAGRGNDAAIAFVTDMEAAAEQAQHQNLSDT